MDRWEPVPVPEGDGRHDIGDDVRAAIVRRLTDDWSHDPDLTPEKARQLAMWAGASVRALLHELGTLRDLAGSASSSPVEAQGWQPIETAPKDGTQVLLWDGAADMGYFSVRMGRWYSSTDDDGFSHSLPTHWMPLPDPPALSSTGATEPE